MSNKNEKYKRRIPGVKYAEDYKEEIIKMYTIDKLSAGKISKIIGISQPTISRNLKEWGIKSRKNGVDQRKYSLNEHYFDKIDTSEKAYILGFLYADGCSDKKVIKITLSIKDIAILEEIKRCFNSEQPIKIIKGRFCDKEKGYKSADQCSLALNSKYLHDEMKKYGIIENKTEKITFPYWLDEKLIPSFILGYFDGDGCISRMKKTGIMIHIVSNETFINQLSDYLHKKGWNNTVRKSTKKSNVAYSLFMYKKQHIKEFLDWIYKDSTIHLQRKYDRYYSYFYENKLIIPYKE